MRIGQQETEAVQRQPANKTRSPPVECQLRPSQRPCHPGDGNGRISARSRLTAVRLQAYPLDQLAAYQQNCLVTNK